MSQAKALVLTHGFLNTINAKTCHGLLRYSAKFSVEGILDQKFAGQSIAEIMEDDSVNAEIYSSANDFYSKSAEKPKFLIIGVATHGGLLPESFVPDILTAIENGCSIVNGLHDYMCENETIAAAAKANNVELIDIRKPKPIKDLHFWKGDIYDVNADVVAVLGVDCALGKRTTAGMIHEMCNRKGLNTEMIYTGQTGWMQGYKHGFIFDATLNDFIAGEIEKSIVTCDQEENPDLILLEGQSSLRNPSGPGGSEFLVSGNAKGVILQIAPRRTYFEGYEDMHLIIPSAADEIELINKYGSEVIAITLYSQGVTDEAVQRQKIVLEKELSLPVVAPIKEGVDEIYYALNAHIRDRQVERNARTHANAEA